MLHFSSINRSCPAFSTFPAVITHSFSLQCHNDSAVARIYGCNASRIRDHYLTEVCPFTHDLFHVLSTYFRSFLLLSAPAMSKNGRLDRCRIEIDRQDQIDVSLLLVPDKARGFRIHHVQSHFLIIDDTQRIT